jgi:hypothetical protein
MLPVRNASDEKHGFFFRVLSVYSVAKNMSTVLKMSKKRSTTSFMQRAMAILSTLIVLTVCSCGYSEQGYLASTPSTGSLHTVGNDYYGSFAFSSRSQSLPSEVVTPQQSGNTTTDRVETIDRKIIKKGEISFETEDIDKTKSSIVQTVRELSGYIAEDNVVNHSHRIEHWLAIRVPADKFDLLLENISEGVDKFDQKNINTLDVTEEYIDVQSRIKTKKELQTRYTELLQQATNVDEMLTIEREIGKLQTEIESAEGRMRYLNDRIAFSTLAVIFYQTLIMPEASKFSFYSEFMTGIKTGWELFLWFIIGLSYLWVYIIIVIIAITCSLVRRKMKKKNI